MLLQGMSPSMTQSQNRTLTTKTLTKSLELISNAPIIKTTPGNPLQVRTREDEGSRGDEEGDEERERPLTIILSWLMSEKRHLLKYANFYLDQGFDVLTVRATPWQLFWPVTGTQVSCTLILSQHKRQGDLSSPMIWTIDLSGDRQGHHYIHEPESAVQLDHAPRLLCWGIHVRRGKLLFNIYI